MIKNSPFKFLDAYQKKDFKIFFGRENETKALYDALSGVKHLLVYGSSGSGKTSLVECGLRNQFSNADWFALTIRKGNNINASVFSAINEQLKNQFEIDAITNLPIDGKVSFETMVERLFTERYKPVYLLFDQFEELLISGTSEEQQTFFTNLDKLIRYRIPCRVLLIMREEFVGYLSEFEKYCPTIFQNRFRLEKIRRTNAREVIVNTLTAPKFQKEFTVTDAEGFSDAILSKLPDNRSEIELTHIQVFLNELWERADKTTNELPVLEKSLITDDKKDEKGAIIKKGDSLDTILDTFLKKQLKNMEALHGEKIPLEVLACLISNKNTKLQFRQNEIQKDLEDKEIEVSDLTGLLQTFKTNKIVREIRLNHELHYEITHDILAQVIGNNITEEMRLREKARGVYDLYQEREGFYSQIDLNYLQPFELFLSFPLELKSRVEESQERIKKVAAEEKMNHEAELKKEKGLRRRAIYVALIAMMITVVAGYFYFEAEKANELAESNLFRAAVIAQHSDKNPLFERSSYSIDGYDFNDIFYEKIETLNFRGWNITKMPNEVFQCENLTSLDLSENQISDIRSLEKLAKLSILDLSANQISDIRSLEKLTNLTILDLSANQISDIRSLEKLNKLISLHLIENQISDIHSLEKLTGLTTLYLHSNEISDIHSLEKLTGLTTLYLVSNQISDYSSLEKLTELTTLYLNFNGISDISSLEKLTKLTTLSLWRNQISDISSLENLKNLTTLSLVSNEISDISSLEKLKNLQKLILRENPLTEDQINDLRKKLPNCEIEF